jgi:nicotinamidase-related amidase
LSGSIIEESRSFLDWLANWYNTLEPFDLAAEIKDPSKASVFSADMVIGFCSQGSLASERIEGLVEPVVALFRLAYEHGIRNFVLVQDTHDKESPEFEAWPSHCLSGTPESETVPELKSLPFSNLYTIIPKNSLHPAIGTELEEWLQEHGTREMIVVGDCTDLCTYQLAMHLRMRANAYNIKNARVIVPANGVQTYDLQAGEGMPHPGDFLHLLFLYHMALNGCMVVSEIR